MAKIYVSDILKKCMVKLNQSWCWIKDDFVDEFNVAIRDNHDIENQGFQKIWDTGKNFVLLMPLKSGRTVVYKKCRKMKTFPYIFYPSPTAREALNYSILENMGFAVAKVLATGDERRFLRPGSSFIITEFVDNSQDGRVFMLNGPYADNSALKNDFFEKNLVLLAKLHDLSFYHRGFTPANILWRLLDNEHVDPIWIDVATCKKLPKFILKKHIADDLLNFFRFFDLSAEERENYINFYLSNVKNKMVDLCEIKSHVDKKLELRYKHEISRGRPPVPRYK